MSNQSTPDDLAEDERAIRTFGDLRTANVERNREWWHNTKSDLAFRAIELAGEAGEVCNVVKKLERERLGMRGSRDTKEHLAEELADVFICTDLLAMEAGIDLEAAVAAKFNATSEKYGLSVRYEPTKADPALVAEVKRLTQERDDARAEVERLRAVVEKLPKTVDGVPIVPGMCVWSRDFGWMSGDALEKETVETVGCDFAWFSRMDGFAVLACHLYSTQAAALAAAGKEIK